MVPCRIPKQKFATKFFREDGKKEVKEIQWLESSYFIMDKAKKKYIGGYGVCMG